MCLFSKSQFTISRNRVLGASASGARRCDCGSNGGDRRRTPPSSIRRFRSRQDWRTLLNESVLCFSHRLHPYGKSDRLEYLAFANYDLRENRHERTPGRDDPACTTPANCIIGGGRARGPNNWGEPPKFPTFGCLGSEIFSPRPVRGRA